jgi:hypothetical protein
MAAIIHISAKTNFNGTGNISWCGAAFIGYTKLAGSNTKPKRKQQ